MPAKKFLRYVGGIFTEITATVVSAGAGNDGDIVALDSTGKLDTSVMPVGIGADTKVIQASENLSAGDFVNVHNASGPRVRKADSANGFNADGFVLTGVTSGANATVYFEGTNTQLTGMTVGARQYLSTTGSRTETSPTTAGHISQYLGKAISATELSFEGDAHVVIA